MGSGNFGKYRLLRLLKRGGMAEVFLATQQGVAGFEKNVVIKRILPHLAQDARLVRMFLDEARLAAKLNHPNIAQIYDLGQIDDEFFIAMEYIPGRDLRDVGRAAKAQLTHLPLAHAVGVVCTLCGALAHAHEARDANGEKLGIVHRDISPHNVLVSFDGTVKLIDFGIAKTYAKLEETHSGTVRGKSAFIAPEQYTGSSTIDGRADIFATGVLLYALVTGELPFPGDSDAERMFRVLNHDMVPPRQWVPDLPEELITTLETAMQKQPEARYQTARQMQGALDDMLMAAGMRSDAASLGELMRCLFPDERDTAPRAGRGTLTLGTEGIESTRGDASEESIEKASNAGSASPNAPRASRRRWIWGAAVVSAVTLGIVVWQAIGDPELDAEEGTASSAATRPPEQHQRDGPTPPVRAVEATGDTEQEQPADAGAKASRQKENKAATGHQASFATEKARETPKRTSKVRRRAQRAASKRAQELRREAETGRGKLTLDATPWAEVYLHGKRLGTTPLAYYELPAGNHDLVLVNPETERRARVTAEIRKGETTRLHIQLE